MIYKVIGLMSGSSLDGLDIVYTQLEEIRGAWTYEIIHAECIPYNTDWIAALRHATDINVNDFLKLNTRYGRYIGEQVNGFIAKYDLVHKVHFIASHGHTVFHEPGNHTTCQIGDGASIAAITGLPVITDLRSVDVALGGQGAPIVPIGDKLLFKDYDYLLNIGGIANVTVQQNSTWMAYDVCPANQVLNALAAREGQPMDTDGAMAAQGKLLRDVLQQLDNAVYYGLQPPKSLSNEAARDMAFPPLLESEHNNYDLLHTATYHIAYQVAESVKKHVDQKGQAKMLVTGGGAFNAFLIAEIRKLLPNIEIVVPSSDLVKFKEALVMALIGVLRWREEITVMSSVTGAGRDSVGGALWLS